MAILPWIENKWLTWSRDNHNTETQHVEVYKYGLGYTLHNLHKKPLKAYPHLTSLDIMVCYAFQTCQLIMLCFSLTEFQNSEHLVQNALYFIWRR